MKYITSAENPIIRTAMSLRHHKGREKEGLYLVEGLHLCEEALDSAGGIDTLLIRGSAYMSTTNELLKSLIAKALKANVKAITVEESIFDKLADTETPQGLAAMVRYKVWDQDEFFAACEKDGCGNILVLDRIQDPGNAGTMLRTAEAAGYHGIVAVKGTVDLYSPKTVRSAAGSLFRLPLLFTQDAEKTVELLRGRGKSLVVAAPESGSYHFQIRLNGNVALVIGNEAGGADGIFLDRADCRVKIPMADPVESLNAAVAAGIIMYESVRQNIHHQAEEEKRQCRQS